MTELEGCFVEKLVAKGWAANWCPKKAEPIGDFGGVCGSAVEEVKGLSYMWTGSVVEYVKGWSVICGSEKLCFVCVEVDAVFWSVKEELLDKPREICVVEYDRGVIHVASGSMEGDVVGCSSVGLSLLLLLKEGGLDVL